MPRALRDLLLLPAIVLISASATIHVPGDVATLAEAIDASASGDTIELACGTHVAANLTVRHHLVIRSETGSAECGVIDAGGSGWLFLARSRTHLTLQGLTLTGADSWVVRQDFGRLELSDCVVSGNHFASSVHVDTLIAARCTFVGNAGRAATGEEWATVTDCLFRGNLGGGLRMGGPGAVTDCSFEENHADLGAGIWTQSYSTAEITNCRFESNVATDRGGALLNAGSAYGYVNVAASTFRGNIAADGGAVGLYRSGRTTMTDCVFEDNEAVRGGAVGGTLSLQPARFERCTFLGNRADLGGVAYLEDARMIFPASTFFDNQADSEGGVAWVDRESRVDFLESTLCGNASGGQSGGLWVQYGLDVSVSLVNTILAFSRSGAALAGNSPAVRLIVRCTDIFGNPGGDWTGPLVPHAGEAGNFSSNPLFCDFIHGDLHLFDGSPCLPEATGCGGVGALGPGCGVVGITPRSWARLKAAYRD